MSRLAIDVSFLIRHSDCFTAWGADNKDVHNQEATQATNQLFSHTIPEVARHFDSLFVSEGSLCSDDSHFPEIPTRSINLVEELHRRGVNCRHIGRVREHTTNLVAKRFMLVEMTARVMKCKVRWNLFATILTNIF